MNIDYLTHFIQTELNSSTKESLINTLIDCDWLDEEDRDDINKVVDALIEYLYKQFENECREIYLYGISIDALFDK